MVHLWLLGLVAFVAWSAWLHWTTYLAPPPKGKPIPGPRALPFLGNLLDFLRESGGQFSANVGWLGT